MAGKIIIDTIDTDNAFITLNVQQSLIATMNVSGIYSNTGVKMIGANGTVSNTAITGLVTAAQIATVANTQITGNITSSQITSNPTFYGNVSVTGAIGVGGATPTSNGSGITFPATQSASSDANTLDDYEEGTFTPTFGSENGAFASVTYIAQNGRYVKIGKTVYVNILVGWSAFSIGTASGDVQIKGLPFVSTDSDALFTTETLDVNWPNAGTIAGQSNADATIFFRVSQSNGAWNTVLVSAQGSAETNYIRLSGTYLTTT